MGTKFAITAKHTADVYTDEVVAGDTVSYEFNAAPWQEDNSAITSATWTVESGSASVSNKTLTSGVASALISYPDIGKSVISLLLTTATVKKKVYLVVKAIDTSVRYSDSDYGLDV